MFILAPDANASTAQSTPTPGLIPIASTEQSISISPNGSTVYLASQDSTISAIDTASDQVKATIPIQVAPYLVRETPGGARALVLNRNLKWSPGLNDHGAVEVISTATSRITNRIVVGNEPLSLDVSPNGAIAYVMNMNDAMDKPTLRTMSEIDLATESVTATLQVDADANPGVTFSPDSNYALLLNAPLGAAGSVSVIDVQSGAIVSTIDVGQSPRSVAFAPDGKTAYVADGTRTTGEVSVIDLATMSVVKTVPVGANPSSVAFSPGGNVAYVGNAGSHSVSVIAVESSSVEGTIALAGAANSVTFTPDGKYALVGTSQNLSAIDVATGAITATIGDGIPHDAVVVTPDGAKAFMPGGNVDGDYRRAVVQVIDLQSIGWAPSVERIAGDDRFATSVRISQAGFTGKAPVVYVATGNNFPDALSAAPAAAHEGGPLLLTESSVLRADVKAEIQRLAPAKIVVVGGPAAISADMYRQLSALAPSIERAAGPDRYGTSEAIASQAFGESIGSAYVATGLNYPDALSASAAAGAQDKPMILVNGHQSGLDADRMSYLRHLGTSSFTIIGGPDAVTLGIESSLKTLGSVERIGGQDRFVTSRLINQVEFPHALTAFIATGQNFPDALSGAALAAESESPLYVTPQSCIPVGVEDDLVGREANAITLLGGESALSERVAELAIC